MDDKLQRRITLCHDANITSIIIPRKDFMKSMIISYLS